MFTEKDMEDRIAEAPDECLGESGLRLVGRQVKVGRYVFDLLFEDRHKSKLIVEIQKGTLDRNHTYKILDYYDAYREKHSDEFIDLMVVENVIPHERKKRLQYYGISYKELPDALFQIGDKSTGEHRDMQNGKAKPVRQEIDRARAAESSVVEITPTMRRHWNDRSLVDHFGFSGRRACMACLYARPEGATQSEVNEVASTMGSTQRDYRNMLRMALQWGHQVFVWHEETRGGKVYKLIYNPNYKALRSGPEPADYVETNKISAPPVQMSKSGRSHCSPTAVGYYKTARLQRIWFRLENRIPQR